MTSVLKKLPSVLSFQRGLIISDGLFFNELADGAISPLHVIRHGILGTQNINKTESSENAGTAASGKREDVRNPQRTDSAKLLPGAVGLQVRFDLRVVAMRELLFACAPGKNDNPRVLAALRESLSDFISRAEASDGLVEVCRRYARNIANGRFLWRNRTIARSVRVVASENDRAIASFDALALGLNEFGNYSVDEQKLAAVIVSGLKGNRLAKLSVRAHVDFGVQAPVEVFPSQNYLGLKKTEGFARSLYCVGKEEISRRDNSIEELGQAAIRDQKIGNALRTIDTWYPAFGSRRQPIPVEPNGASLDAQEFFRQSKEASAFSLMLRMSQLDPNSDEGMFLMACLVRGGVFSGSDK